MDKSWAWAAVAVSLAASGAAAQADRALEWVNKPNVNQLKANWPVAAWRDGVSGTAAIRCTVGVTGLLSGCRVVTETPAGYGFGDAVMHMAPSFVFRPAIRNGAPVTSDITIPISFKSNGVRVPSGPETLIMESEARRIASNVIWDAAPTAADMKEAWPSSGGEEPFGHVVVRCRVREDGSLKACERVSELPDRRGFYPAARALLPKFKVRVDGVDPRQLAQIEVNLPIHLTNPKAEPIKLVLTRPEWARSYSADQVTEMFPAKAAEARLATGRAVIECRVAAAGELKDCGAIEETPGEMDFGVMATRLAHTLAVNAWTPEGLPAEGAKVKVAIRLNNADAPAAAN